MKPEDAKRLEEIKARWGLDPQPGPESPTQYVTISPLHNDFRFLLRVIEERGKLLTDLAAELEITHADDMKGGCCCDPDDRCEASKLLARLAAELGRPDLVPVLTEEEILPSKRAKFSKSKKQTERDPDQGSLVAGKDPA